MASSTLFGQVGEFDPDSEKISTYLERVKLFVEANSVADEKKVAVLLTIIGVKNYTLLEGLLAPTNPREKSYDELTQMLKAYYEPKLVVIAERFVQSVKQALRISVANGRTLLQRLYNFLLTYRRTPHATTGVSPCSLFLQRNVRTRLDLLLPNRKSHVLMRQAQQKAAHDPRAQDREWFIGQPVMARNLRPGPDWIARIIVERLGPLSYLVETETHQLWKRHVDQLKEVSDSLLKPMEFEVVPERDDTVPVIPTSSEFIPASMSESSECTPNRPESAVVIPDPSPPAAITTTPEPEPSVTRVPSTSSPKSTTSTPTPPTVSIRRSTRKRKPREWYF